MRKFIETMDNLPFIAKIILCIPVLDVIWNVTRLLKSIEKKNIVGIVIAGALLVIGAPFVWLIDLIFIILKGNIWWLD